MARGQLGLGGVAHNISFNLQHYNPDLSRRANLPSNGSQVWLTSRSRIFFHGLLVLSIILGFFAFPYNSPVLAIAGCVGAVFCLGWIAKRIPNISPTRRNLTMSWKVLTPTGASVPAFFFFFFTSALIPFALVTVVVGAVVVCGYERILEKWARKGFNDVQRLGLMAGALGFWAVFFDLILELIGSLGTIVLGACFVVYLLYLRKKTLPRLIGHSMVQVGSGSSKSSAVA